MGERRPFAAINATALPAHPAQERRSQPCSCTSCARPPDPNTVEPLHEIDLVRVRERSRTLTHIARSPPPTVSSASPPTRPFSTAPVSAEMLRLATHGPHSDGFFTDDEETRKERVVV